jgi:hypothetical protein
MLFAMCPCSNGWTGLAVRLAILLLSAVSCHADREEKLRQSGANAAVEQITKWGVDRSVSLPHSHATWHMPDVMATEQITTSLCSVCATVAPELQIAAEIGTTTPPLSAPVYDLLDSGTTLSPQETARRNEILWGSAAGGIAALGATAGVITAIIRHSMAMKTTTTTDPCSTSFDSPGDDDSTRYRPVDDRKPPQSSTDDRLVVAGIVGPSSSLFDRGKQHAGFLQKHGTSLRPARATPSLEQTAAPRSTSMVGETALATLSVGLTSTTLASPTAPGNLELAQTAAPQALLTSPANPGKVANAQVSSGSSGYIGAVLALIVVACLIVSVCVLVLRSRRRKNTILQDDEDEGEPLGDGTEEVE